MVDTPGSLGGSLHHETAQMQTAVAHMDSTSSQIRALLKSITTTVADSSAWQGDAAGTFNVSMAQWNDAAIKMDKVLQDIQAGVHGSDVAVNNKEADNVAALQRAGAGITFGLSQA
jgi:WXG100 family type VII secretion target